MEMEFKVNKEAKAVQATVFDEGKQRGSMVLENCIIFDEKNWNCERENSIGSRRMANGIYSDDTNTTYYNPPLPHKCAK